MTAAHSAGTAVFSSLRQLATSASRSIVRMPVAPASAAVWFASGERMESPGSGNFGSEAMFMPYFRRLPAPRQLSIAAVWQGAFVAEVAETGHARLELELDGAGRAVALLADYHLGLAVHERHVQLPFFVFGRARAGLLVGEIILLAKHEHHDVRVLLDRTGFAKIGQLRALVVTVFDLTRQLRQRDDRNVEFFGERLQTGGDFRDFLDAVVGAPRRALEELNVVDHQQVETSLPLQSPRACGQLGNRETTGFVNIERQRLELDRIIADLLEIVLGDPAAADCAGGNSGAFGDDTGGELLSRHFAGEESDNAAIDGFHRAVSLKFGAVRLRDVVGNVGRERGLAHARSARDDDQVGRLQAAHLGVEVAKPGGDAG